ncbi:NFACT RNA binding domain-containing protein [Borrelia hermsii]|uniref:Fibronectin-binding protein / Fibrinogen-binding protein n=4 Tax=Borrelia hermsii TaxID=140 RepID=A0AAN1CEV4_BORHE|nr:NFACT RNA binding domain-containing protein [Borrelia hermsii]AAX16860.1 fibronectin-binding protein [Borrelia hermsii DAH]AJW73159.1 ferrous iron transporter A [Borrelia hermsii CC1]AMR75489.1 Fibronectin-binding protein / Fibrinogen-binding protein [Borrelia hermsii]ANA43159.1 ferrous iron transporter A [Borrelia hermsii HS1]UEQ06993.1 NFACT RNA binding domain-containing protein [Borrelia hermsii]
MSLNYNEINVLLQELPFKNSFLRKIKQPNHKTLVMELYNKEINEKNFNVLIALEPKKTRIHKTNKKFANIKPSLRFFEFLKSKVQNGKISEAYQIKNERIILIKVLKDKITIFIFIKLWPSSPNIIVTDANFKILDAYYRRPNSKEITGEIFTKVKEIIENNDITDKNEVNLKDGYNNELSYSEFIENYYDDLEIKETQAQNIELLKKKYEKEKINLEKKISFLEKQIKSIETIGAQREKGELILLNINKIKKGMDTIILKNHNGEQIKIMLDKALLPQDNALKYFKEYKKNKNALKIIQEQLEHAKTQYDALILNTTCIDSQNCITLANERIKKQKIIQKPSIGLNFISYGFEIVVGRNAKENDELLRSWAKGNDYWLHTRDYPGAYVFIRNKKDKTPPLEVLIDAGNLCVFYTKPARQSGEADLYYTNVKHLRRIKGGKKGLVIPNREKNLNIKLDPKILNKLKQNLSS